MKSVSSPNSTNFTICQALVEGALYTHDHSIILRVLLLGPKYKLRPSPKIGPLLHGVLFLGACTFFFNFCRCMSSGVLCLVVVVFFFYVFHTFAEGPLT